MRSVEDEALDSLCVPGSGTCHEMIRGLSDQSPVPLGRAVSTDTEFHYQWPKIPSNFLHPTLN